MWKAGCLTAMAGLFLTVGSVVFFGTAIQKAVSSREVASERMDAGLLFESRDIQVDPSGRIQVQINTKVELSEDQLAAVESAASILQLSTSVSYEVRDETGALIYNESGAASGSTIVPAASSSHRDSFDPVVQCTFEGTRFDAPDFGLIRVLAEIPQVDDDGNKIRSGRLVVLDQIPQNTSRWAWGGLLSMLIGPFVIFVGFVIFVIGLLTRKKRVAGGVIPPVP